MDFVLVHGTTQSERGWDLLVEALDARGHRGYCLDLTRIASDAPVKVFAEYAAHWWSRQGRSRDGESRPVVVAHSGSGVLLPALARALHAPHQVWLAAYVPDYTGGRSLAEEAGGAPETMFNPEWLGEDPFADPVAALYFLFHDCDLATARWALTTLHPLQADTVYQGKPSVDPQELPSTYLLPAEDRTLRPGWMRQAARQRLGVDPVELPGGHCPHVSRPDVVAEALGELSG